MVVYSFTNSPYSFSIKGEIVWWPFVDLFFQRSHPKWIITTTKKQKEKREKEKHWQIYTSAFSFKDAISPSHPPFPSIQCSTLYTMCNDKAYAIHCGVVQGSNPWTRGGGVFGEGEGGDQYMGVSEYKDGRWSMFVVEGPMHGLLIIWWSMWAPQTRSHRTCVEVLITKFLHITHTHTHTLIIIMNCFVDEMPILANNQSQRICENHYWRRKIKVTMLIFKP